MADRQSAGKKNIDAIYPLSPTQQGIVFHSLLEPGSGMYETQTDFRLRGLDVAAMQRAWQEVTNRHTVLRTLFKLDRGREPLQVVLTEVTLAWHQEDWRGLDVEEQHRRLELFLREDRKRGIDLSQAPLMRFALLRVDDDLYHLVWTHQHAITDGWSVPILLGEVFALYEAYHAGRELQLPAPVPYERFIEWLSRQDRSAAEEYWKRTLASVGAPTRLPLDERREPSDDQRCGTHSLEVPKITTSALERLAREHQITLNTIVHGAWAMLLSRYCGDRDVVYGATQSGRPAMLPGVNSIIGLFINTLPTRVRVDHDAELIAWLQELQLNQAEARAFEYSSLADIQKWSGLPPHQALFDTIVVFENYPRPRQPDVDVNRKTLTVERTQWHSSTNYTVAMVAAPGPPLKVNLLTDLRVLRPETAERMARHYLQLLEAIAADPRRPLGEIDMLSGPERNQILVAWNDTKTDFPREKCVHELFEEQVRRTPENIAVEYDGACLTYAELDRESNRLANHLRTLGVIDGTMVCICLDRSEAMIVAMLAILKAGGAYVPLDPTYPRQRLRYMLQDTGAPVVLTETDHSEALGMTATQLVCLDRDGPSIAACALKPPRNHAASSDVAYVIYTSGSTGQPKGVRVPHRAINRLVVNTDYVQLRSTDRIAQASNANFDAATFEIWGALLHGARLVGVSKETLLSGTVLADRVSQHGINVMFVTTALFNQLVKEVPNIFSTFRYVLFGGETVEPQWVHECLLHGQPRALLHVYGPTEATTFATWHEVKEVAPEAITVPIGRPIANTQTYILDERMQPVATNVSGELYIGGPGLAVDYLNQPELTAEKFVDNPFAPTMGDRLYRTGDLARWNAAAHIEFLGRVDDQVKIRGFRVELGEIEAVLCQYEHVDETCVLAREDIPGDKRLVAYVVPSQRDVPSPEELRRFLKDRLPDYMVPAAFVPLEALPLTPNGKVDRSALAEIEVGRQTTEESYVAPRTPVEQQLAQIWKEVLWLKHDVGVHDDFFDLGGHSLLSVRLVAKIENEFKQKVPLAALFQLSTIAELAPLLEQKVETHSASSDIAQPPPRVIDSPLDPELYRQLLAYTAGWKGQRTAPSALMVGQNTAGTKQPLFWCLQGFRELSQLAKYLGQDQPTYGMRSGHLAMKYTPANVKALTEHYVAEIVTVQPEGPYLIGGNCQAATIATEIARQLQRQEQTVSLLCLLDNPRPQTYSGRIALIFGRESKLNPYRYFSSPEMGWRKLYPGGFSVDHLVGEHGQFFSEPSIQVLAEKVRHRIEQVQQASETRRDSAIQSQPLISPLPDHAFRAGITAQTTCCAAAGEKVSIAVRVRNNGTVTWPTTDKSGITLGNHWINPDGESVRWMDGSVPLPQDVAPGSQATMNLIVTAPDEPGRYKMEIDLAEEGITWFKNKGSQTAIIDFEIPSGDKRRPLTVAEDGFPLTGYEESLCRNFPYPRLIAGGPNVIGGTGGSGTRVIARIVVNAGMFLGSVRNPSEDSLEICTPPWYKPLTSHWRTAMPQETYDRMMQQFSTALKSFLAPLASAEKTSPWGWKIPPTIFWLPFLHRQFPHMKCLHLLRDGRDMAFSPNQNQLRYLGPVLLNDEEQSWGLSLRSMALWNRLNLLTAQYAEQHMPEAYLRVRFEDLFENPESTIETILDFFDLEADISRLALAEVSPPASLGRWYAQDRGVVKALDRIGEIGLRKFGYLSPESLPPPRLPPRIGHTCGKDAEHRSRGKAAFEKGDFQRAADCYRQAIKLDPQQPVEVHQRLGCALVQQGKFESAIAAYHEALRLEPENARIQFLLGNAQRQQGNASAALSSYEKAIELDVADCWELYEKAGEVYLEQDRFSDAIAAFRHALHLQPENLKLVHDLARAQLQSGNIEAAADNFQKIVDLNPESFQGYIGLGNALNRMDRVTEAYAACEKSIQLQPANPHAHFVLGNIRRKRGELDLAIDCYQKALELNHKQPFAVYKNLADVSREQGKLEEAVTAYSEAAKFRPLNPDVHRRLGNTLRQLGNVEAADASLRKAKELTADRHPSTNLPQRETRLETRRSQLDLPPIFIVGHPRSGTTWLSELLGSHSRLASGPESHLFNFYLERLFKARDRWLVNWVDDTTLDQLIAQFVEGIFQARLTTTGKTRIVEKTPAHRDWLDQITALFPGAKVIHCIRDGRDVALSMLARRHKTGEKWIPGTLEECAKRWQDVMQLMAKYKNEWAGSFVEVHYESLLSCPEDQLRRLLRQLNENDNSQELRQMLVANPVSANQTEKWRNQLTSSQRKVFLEVAGETLEALGYPV